MSNAIGFNLENNRLAGDGDRKPVLLAKAAVCSEAAVNGAAATTTRKSQGVDVATLVAILRMAVVRRLPLVTRSRSWRSIIQLFIEKVLVNLNFLSL